MLWYRIVHSKTLHLLNMAMEKTVTSIEDLTSIKGLKIAHLNVRSHVDKIDQLRVLLSNQPVDILCLSETWTNANHTSTFLEIPGYELNLHNRSTTDDRGNPKRGGGIGYYTRCNANFSITPLSDLNTCGKDIESGWFDIRYKHSRPIILGVVLGGAEGLICPKFYTDNHKHPPPPGHCPRDVIHPPKNTPTLGHSQAPPPWTLPVCDVIIHIPKGLICSFLWPIFSSCFARISPTVCPNFTHCLPEFHPLFARIWGATAPPLPPPAWYAYVQTTRWFCWQLPKCASQDTKRYSSSKRDNADWWFQHWLSEEWQQLQEN